MMGFIKIELLFLLISLQFLLLLPLDENPSTAPDLIQGTNTTDQKHARGDGKMTATLTGSKRVVSVGRRAIGGGGHGGGGGHASSGSRGGGGGGRAIGGRGGAGGEGKGSSSQVNRGPNLIPFYVAGAMPHRQNNQHHRNGSGQGNRSSFSPPGLLLVLLLVVYLLNMLHR